jgi:hypothetical protein
MWGLKWEGPILVATWRPPCLTPDMSSFGACWHRVQRRAWRISTLEFARAHGSCEFSGSARILRRVSGHSFLGTLFGFFALFLLALHFLLALLKCNAHEHSHLSKCNCEKKVGFATDRIHDRRRWSICYVHVHCRYGYPRHAHHCEGGWLWV